MMGRLDLHPAFLRLETELYTLRLLTVISLTIRDAALVPATLNITIERAKANGYVPVLMTKDRWESLAFIIDHIGDAARRVDDQYQAALEASMKVAS